jgi:hypothetical protein
MEPIITVTWKLKEAKEACIDLMYKKEKNTDFVSPCELFLPLYFLIKKYNIDLMSYMFTASYKIGNIK